MTLLGVILSVIGQLVLSGHFLIFAPGLALELNLKRKLTTAQKDNLVTANMILILQGFIIAGCMLWWFFQDAGSEVYRWHFLPVACALCYLGYVRYLYSSCPKKR